LPQEQEILDRLRKSVVTGDEEAARLVTRDATENNIDPVKILEEALIPGIAEVGGKFERMEAYLTDMMMAADAMKAGMSIALAKIPQEKIRRIGTIVLGTVKGDIHEIGKNILSALLTAAGVDVHDVGCDVPASVFAAKAEEVGAIIIGASALMTTTLPGQKDIVDYLNSTGKRDKYSLLVGGGPTTEQWAKEIGAEGYAETATDGVKLALRQFGERGRRSTV
jgi:trimethylamine corrinoid protein